MRFVSGLFLLPVQIEIAHAKCTQAKTLNFHFASLFDTQKFSNMLFEKE